MNRRKRSRIVVYLMCERFFKFHERVLHSTYNIIIIITCVSTTFAMLGVSLNSSSSSKDKPTLLKRKIYVEKH